jgi:hypothetical protein
MTLRIVRVTSRGLVAILSNEHSKFGNKIVIIVIIMFMLLVRE